MDSLTAFTIFGTRPEAIKLAPVIWALERQAPEWRCVNVCSSQHTDLLRPFLGLLGLRVDHDLAVMRDHQSPAEVLARVVGGVHELIRARRPDVVVVQGDTTTALAGALAAFYARVPVAHVEAGLRTGDATSPFPEEAHRRLIAITADLHFAATQRNVDTLHAEGCAADRVRLTGNPVVDALDWIRGRSVPSVRLQALLARLEGQRIIALTTHRRENFGAVMESHLTAIRDFVAEAHDVAVVFPVHPNPEVRRVANRLLADQPRVHLVDPLDYGDFIHLLTRAWLICSDSGGIQEEAPSLRKPVLILRDTTERPEVIECGAGRLVGHSGARLLQMLREAHADDAWTRHAGVAANPFGDGDSGERIAALLTQRYRHKRELEAA